MDKLTFSSDFTEDDLRSILDGLAPIVSGDIDSVYVADHDWWDEVVDHMAFLGLHFLGSGFFSGAWLVPNTEVVIKVGFKPHADSGLSYAQWCRQNSKLVGVPEVNRLVVHEEMWAMGTKRYATEAATLSEGVQRCIKSDLSSVIYGRDSEYSHCEEVENTVTLIRAYFLGTARFDLHSDNVMWLDDTPIITDPTSFLFGTEDDDDYMGTECWDTESTEETLP